MNKPLYEQRPDAVICVCMEVTETEIRQAIRDGYKDLPLLSKKLLIGTGCSSCICEVQEIIKEEQINNE